MQFTTYIHPNMPTWYIGRIRRQKTDDSSSVDTRKGAGDLPKQITVTETRLIDAVSHTDAEARLTAAVADNAPDFEITLLRPVKFGDVYHKEGGDNWYKCKAYYMTEDDRGRAKKVPTTALMNAANLREAMQRLADVFSAFLVPVEITDLNLTPILDVVYHQDPPRPAN